MEEKKNGKRRLKKLLNSPQVTVFNADNISDQCIGTPAEPDVEEEEV